MGIFDKFKEYKKNKTISQAEKAGETLKNVVTTKDQRLEAIDILSKCPGEIAIPQLIKRFELVVDHGIQDTREKEMVTEAILSFKDLAKPFMVESLKKSKRISWPIKLSEKLFPKEEFLTLLLENLNDEFIAFDEVILERNIEILLALKEFHDEKILARVAKLCKNKDEGVRMAAIECIEAQAEMFPDARKIIVDLAKEPPTDDNSRLLGTVKSIVEKHNWR